MDAEGAAQADETPADRAALLEELEAARFIARASATLAQVTGYEATLERIASLAVPAFADWFGVHVREAGGGLRRLAVRHQDERMKAAVEEMYRRYPPNEGEPYGAPKVVATGEALWLPRFEAAIPVVARDAGHARLLAALGLRSFICVPMRSHGQVLGALTFATAESGRDYSRVHFAAAEDLAARAAIAIENAMLVEALREADRRKDEFLAILAHELRNPLAPLRNAVELLRARAAAPDGVDDVIDRQVRQMSRLVDDLMDVARFTRGRIELRRSRVALAEVAEAALEAARPAIERARHALEVSLPREPVWLDADPMRLAQVLANLLHNAAKYTPAGGRIALEAAVEGGEVAIRVRDDGIGIPPAMLERIFDMFVQVERAASRGGLGIGLTLVRRLVELHGGTVVAESEGEGRGARFTVRLPLERAPAPARDAGGDWPLRAMRSRVAAMAGTSAAPVPAPRVLVVDDNEDAADSLATLLGVMGYEVRTAYDGPEAIAAADEFLPAVALLDIGLPRLSGYDIARHVRAHRGAGVLLVAITGWGQEEDRKRARDAGFDHHFTKPADFGVLLELIGRATGQAPPA